jgi:hypothetical protein
VPAVLMQEYGPHQIRDRYRFTGRQPAQPVSIPEHLATGIAQFQTPAAGSATLSGRTGHQGEAILNLPANQISIEVHSPHGLLDEVLLASHETKKNMVRRNKVMISKPRFRDGARKDRLGRVRVFIREQVDHRSSSDYIFKSVWTQEPPSSAPFNRTTARTPVVC